MKKLRFLLLILLSFIMVGCDMVEHVHDYTTQKHDDFYHWMECSCGSKNNLEGHVFDEGVITKEATEEEYGEKVYSCKTCGYQKIEQLPKIINSEKGDVFTIYSIEMKGTYGDSNIIQYKNYDILIDGGTNSDAKMVQAALKDRVTDHSLDLLINSHPDSDHYSGLLSNSKFDGIDEIKTVITNGDSRSEDILINSLKANYPSTNYTKIQEYVSSTNLESVISVDDEFSIHLLYQENYDSTTASKNNKSIAVEIVYKNTIVFMGGDMEVSACNSLMKYHPNLTTKDNLVIYKALHHCSNGTNKDEFLSYMKPDLCFISTGLKLSSSDSTPTFSNHPYLDALQRIGRQTKEVYWSSIMGNTTITCDGESYTVEGAGRSVDYYYITKSVTGKILADRDLEKSCTLFESKWYQLAIEYQNATNFANIKIE